MNSIDRELAVAVKNLSSLQSNAVPKASAMAINRVAARAVSRSVKDTAKAVRIKQKVIRPRASITKKGHRENARGFCQSAQVRCSCHLYRYG